MSSYGTYGPHRANVFPKWSTSRKELLYTQCAKDCGPHNRACEYVSHNPWQMWYIRALIYFKISTC